MQDHQENLKFTDIIKVTPSWREEELQPAVLYTDGDFLHAVKYDTSGGAVPVGSTARG